MEDDRPVCLEVREITKSYKKGIQAVDHLSFTLREGEILGLVGTNGAGKSTTVSMLVSIVKPDEGSIIFCGQPVGKKAADMHGKIGYVPQEIALYESLSGYDNLRFWAQAAHVPRKIIRERIADVAEKIGFSAEMLQKKVKNYSGGWKRRLNIGAALLSKPTLLVLDEPTVGIDLASRNHIVQSIRNLAKEGVSVVYVGHYLEEVERLCDRVILMDCGRMVYEGNIREGLTLDGRAATLEEIYERFLAL